MGSDEEGTLQRLKPHRREVIDPKIKEYRGRIVKTTGDGLLAEFPSVVDAVRCGLMIQRAMVQRNLGIAPDNHITLRAGINLGDVMIDGDDLTRAGSGIVASQVRTGLSAGGRWIRTLGPPWRMAPGPPSAELREVPAGQFAVRT
jgi:class 3 adenylate cyclase